LEGVNPFLRPFGRTLRIKGENPKKKSNFQNVTGGVYKIQIQIHRDKV